MTADNEVQGGKALQTLPFFLIAAFPIFQKTLYGAARFVIGEG